MDSGYFYVKLETPSLLGSVLTLFAACLWRWFRLLFTISSSELLLCIKCLPEPAVSVPKSCIRNLLRIWSSLTARRRISICAVVLSERLDIWSRYKLTVLSYTTLTGSLLRLAIDLGNRLLPAFDTPTGIPALRVWDRGTTVLIRFVIWVPAHRPFFCTTCGFS